MRGRIITSDHRIFELPVLLRWNITYTGGVPCDSYEVTCVYDRTMARAAASGGGFPGAGRERRGAAAGHRGRVRGGAGRRRD